MTENNGALRVRKFRNGWNVEQWADGVGWFRVAWFMIEADADKWARDD